MRDVWYHISHDSWKEKSWFKSSEPKWLSNIWYLLNAVKGNRKVWELNFITGRNEMHRKVVRTFTSLQTVSGLILKSFVIIMECVFIEKHTLRFRKEQESYMILPPSCPIRNLLLTTSSPPPQASPAWRCQCTSLRPPRPTSGASWWRLTPSSSPVGSSLPALWTAPSATCSTTDGGQPARNETQTHTPQQISTHGAHCKVVIGGQISFISPGSYHIKCQKKSAWLRRSMEMSARAQVSRWHLPLSHSKCSIWTLRSIRAVVFLLFMWGLAFPAVLMLMPGLFGRMLWFICDNDFWETFIEWWALSDWCLCRHSRRKASGLHVFFSKLYQFPSSASLLPTWNTHVFF